MNTSQHPSLTLSQILQMWWPLAASWLLMSVEGPAHSAIVARLANAEVNLAAWGGIVFPLALIIEAPIIMLLPASTALSKDWDAYVKLRRFMMYTGIFLTLLHLFVTCTPLYYFVVRTIIGVPEATIAPGKIGLLLMTPWSWAIAYRRLHQGVMIRFGHSRAVGTGTFIRLLANGVILTAGYLLNIYNIVLIPGIVVASGAVATGVVAEALYAGLRVRPILNMQLRLEPRAGEPLTLRSFLNFYVPLALTSLISLLVQPIGSMGMSRMPDALSSLAAWPVVNGLLFMLRSGGVAYKEVVIALVKDAHTLEVLRRFTRILLIVSSILILGVAGTSLSHLWFDSVMALPSNLVMMGRRALWLALLLPAMATLDSWYQSLLVHTRHTRSITEAVAFYMVAIVTVMGIGIILNRFPGLYVSIIAFNAAWITQLIWLWIRSRPAIQTIVES
ncbi:MAG: hypothetical protein JXA33_07875 [Anaerolineae bacterium]|nr:hypothetical protein [Anaerolineae bacterium]